MHRTYTMILAAAAVLSTGCTFQLTTNRHEIASPTSSASRVAVEIHDDNLGGGEQAYVNASIIAQLKESAPSVTMAAHGEDLSISVKVLPAHLVNGGWYTILSLGLVKRYFQLGTVRVVNRHTGEIIAVHDILLTGRRVFPLSLDEYQELVLPKIVALIKDEMKTNGALAWNGIPVIDLG